MKAELSTLLGDLFAVPELENFFERRYPHIRASVNFANAPHEVATDAVNALERNGCLTDELFRYLVEARPKHKADIRRAFAGLPPAESTPNRRVPPPAYTTTRERKLGRLLQTMYEQHTNVASLPDAPTVVSREAPKSPPAPRVTAALEAGDWLSSRYKLLRNLGRGGFATVWSAYDTHVGDEVAVKVLQGQHADSDEQVERFLRGARLMQQLDHPNVVRVLEADGHDEGHHYYVMELVKGDDLMRVIKTGRLSPDELLDCIDAIAGALAGAHDRVPPIVHRDVKPASILLTSSGAPKLTDFDLARVRYSVAGNPSAPALGTFVYAAPETLENRSQAGPPADVYGLAMTAFVGLTGRQPDFLAKSNPDVMLDELTVSEPIAVVLRESLQIDPQQRPPNAGAFRQLLRLARKPQASVADGPPPVSADRPPPKAAAGRPARGTVVAIALSIGVAAGIAWKLWAPGSAPNLAQPYTGSERTTRRRLPDGSGAGPIPGQDQRADSKKNDGAANKPDALAELGRSDRGLDPAPKSTANVVPPAVDFISNPSGAVVVLLPGKSRLGTTPFAKSLPRSGEVRVRFSKPGYTSRDVTVGRTGQPVRVVLTKVSAEPKPPPRRGSAKKARGRYKAPKMIRVPGGEFRMGCNRAVDQECMDNEPSSQMTVSSFSIDETEVTVAAYRRCVEAKKCGRTTFKTGGYMASCNWGARGRQNHPMNCVSWHGAAAYCRFVGKRLPTDAEWEKAARSTDGRKYPWGNQPPASCAQAVIDDAKTGWQGRDGCGRESTWPVGSKPAGNSPYGVADMVGNVQEWTADWYQKNRTRSIRGGNWIEGSAVARTSYRSGANPQHRGAGVGFRCVRSK